MSTSSNPELPPPTREASQALFAPLPATRDKESLVEDAHQTPVGGRQPRFPKLSATLCARSLITDEHERGFHPRGVTRQLAAFLASDDRREMLQTIKCTNTGSAREPRTH
jgi:hypothetical protein